MIFGRVPLGEALGGILAHNLQTADRVLRKGALLDKPAYEMLRKAGYEHITIARLEPGDVPEGEAASILATALDGPHLRRSDDVHGRVNLFAQSAGLLRVNARKIERLNLIGEAITLATLPDRSVVAAGDMVATLKIIPFAVSHDDMERAGALILRGQPAFNLKIFKPLKVGLILSELPQLKEAAFAHTIAATRARVEAHGGSLLAPVRTPHRARPMAAAIEAMAEADLILISGASAVTDRQDTAPRAILAAGGRITHFGMPVDPGNLICFGEIGHRPAIVLPGCARSPKLNGFDWVLGRIFAGERIGPADIAQMGTGGLLKEIETRPTPRTRPRDENFGPTPKARPRIGAVILAAGMSRRMAPDNKLLIALPGGKPMVAAVADSVLATPLSPVIAATGHQSEDVRAALAGRKVGFVDTPDYASGMAASLRAGIGALAADVGAALICLGDMPLLDPATLSRIIDAFDPTEGREIIIPVFDGQRGNPVLWGRRFFPALMQLQGDAGGRQILHHYMEFVAEITVSSDNVLRDFDTPQSLTELRAICDQSETL